MLIGKFQMRRIITEAYYYNSNAIIQHSFK